MSKQAIVLDIKGKQVAIGFEYKRCLYEFCQRKNLKLKVKRVENTQNLLNLEEFVSFVNGSREYEETIKEVDPSAEEFPDFSSLSPFERAKTLRKCLKDRLILNSYSKDITPNTVSLQEVATRWGTGISRGGLSRHLKIAAQDLTRGGYNIVSSNGRYRYHP